MCIRDRINGNQTCMMYLYYILTQYKQRGKIKGNEFCVKTIVTTELIKKIADKNLSLIHILTTPVIVRLAALAVANVLTRKHIRTYKYFFLINIEMCIRDSGYSITRFPATGEASQPVGSA